MSLIDRVKAILLRPATEWPVIDGESGDTSLLLGYVACLAAIPAIASFVGMSIVGYTVPTLGTLRVDVVTGVLAAVVQYAMAFLIVYAVAFAVDALAPRFGGEKHLPSALKLTVYAFTPMWLAGIFLLIPGLKFLAILGLYATFLFYTGLPVLMRAPPERAFNYAAAVIAIAIVISLVLGAIRAALFALPGIV